MDKTLMKSYGVQRRAKFNNTDDTTAGSVAHELANDAADGLLQRMTYAHRYRRYDQMSTSHALLPVEWEGSPVVIIVSATVLPIEHIDIYGKNFAEDIEPLVNRLIRAHLAAFPDGCAIPQCDVCSNPHLRDQRDKEDSHSPDNPCGWENCADCYPQEKGKAS